MGLTNVAADFGIPVEIGETRDWSQHSLVKKVGMITHDSGEIDVMATGDWRFELWHPCGLKLRVNFNDCLEDCADLLAEELAERET